MFTYDPLSRRRFAQALSALTALPGFAALAQAQAQAGPRTRYGAHTAEGKKMLAIYHGAVAAMMDPAKYKESDPRSWMFQWYVHAVRPDRTKAAEIQRVYPTPGPARDHANKTWSTCEPHRATSKGSDYFLPWHRMYVGFFEDIIRVVSGKPEFTLPYWDYTTPANLALPPEFLQKDDPQWKALYRPDRNAFANAGRPITDRGLPINLDAMKSALYAGSPTGAGFCANLDGQLHGNVHVSVGNGKGMGQVPWAANDPIFWLHHCNIDRVWASWTKAGGGPPPKSTLEVAFDFADGQGKAVQAIVKNYIAQSVVSYDTYLPRPPGSTPFPTGPLLTSVALRYQSKKATPLKATPTTVPLAVQGSGPLLTSGSSPLANVAPETPVTVVLDGITGNTASEASVYEVHVAAGSQAPKAGDAGTYIGSLNLFGVGGHGEHSKHSAVLRRKVSYLVEGPARAALAAQGTQPKVVLVPLGNTQGQASIDKIEVVAG